eukprot:gene2547-28811_t
MYGAGEIPQAFCRLCAVYAGVYVLRQPTRGFIVDSENDACIGVALDGKAIKAGHVVTSLQCLPESMALPPTPSPSPPGFARACLITDGSILQGSIDPVSITTVPPNAAGNLTAATVICLSSAVAVCPAGKYVVHITAEASAGVTAKQALEPLVRSLTTPSEAQVGGDGGGGSAGAADESSSDGDGNVKGAGKPLLLWEIYFAKDASSLSDDVAAAIPHGLVLSSAKGEGDVHFEKATQDAKRMFHAILPDEEFLPAAPNPEDIVWEGGAAEEEEAAEAPSGDSSASAAESRVAAAETGSAGLRAEIAALSARARVAAVAVSTAEVAAELNALQQRVEALAAHPCLSDESSA